MFNWLSSHRKSLRDTGFILLIQLHTRWLQKVMVTHIVHVYHSSVAVAFFPFFKYNFTTTTHNISVVQSESMLQLCLLQACYTPHSATCESLHFMVGLIPYSSLANFSTCFHSTDPQLIFS